MPSFFVLVGCFVGALVVLNGASKPSHGRISEMIWVVAWFRVGFYKLVFAVYGCLYKFPWIWVLLRDINYVFNYKMLLLRLGYSLCIVRAWHTT